MPQMPKDESELERWLGNSYGAGFLAGVKEKDELLKVISGLAKLVRSEYPKPTTLSEIAETYGPYLFDEAVTEDERAAIKKFEDGE